MPIAADSSYILGSMLELGEIPKDLHMYLYRNDIDVNSLVDNDMNIKEEVEKSFYEWFQNEDPNKVFINELFSILTITDEIDILSRNIMTDLLESLSFNELLEFNQDKKKYLKTKNIIEKIKESKRSSAIAEKIIETVDRFKRVSSLNEVSLIKAIEIEKDRILTIKEEERKVKEYISMLNGQSDVNKENKISKHITTEQIKVFFEKSKREKKSIKKKIFKSINLFKKYLGEDALKIFFSGEELKLTSNKYIYSIQKKNNQTLVNNMDNTNLIHIPYKLDIYDKETNVFLSSMCVYFDKTPILDQIVGLSLYIKDQETEKTFLEAANYFNINRKDFQHSGLNKILEERSKKQLENEAPPVNIEDNISEMTLKEHLFFNYTYEIYNKLNCYFKFPENEWNFLLGHDLIVSNLIDGLPERTHWELQKISPSLILENHSYDINI